MVTKIFLNSINNNCYTRKGFNSCFKCACMDKCCQYSADVDKESYDLLIQHRYIVEPYIGRKIEDCFSVILKDTEYLGGFAYKAIKGKDGYCIFHSKTEKGCILYSLVMSGIIQHRRLIPSICRLYPLTWNNGVLSMYDEDGIPSDCECEITNKHNVSNKSLYQTQQQEIKDIFNMQLVNMEELHKRPLI